MKTWHCTKLLKRLWRFPGLIKQIATDDQVIFYLVRSSGSYDVIVLELNSIYPAHFQRYLRSKSFDHVVAVWVYLNMMDKDIMYKDLRVTSLYAIYYNLDWVLLFDPNFYIKWEWMDNCYWWKFSLPGLKRQYLPVYLRQVAGRLHWQCSRYTPSQPHRLQHQPPTR